MILRNATLADFTELVLMYKDLSKIVYHNLKINDDIFFYGTVIEWFKRKRDIVIADDNGTIAGFTLAYVEDLQIVTLENAIYMGMKNDLAFIIDTNLYLYEHQSTYNPNIPLRDLFYISNEYQKLVDKKSLYSSTLQKIPAPNFIEFYNGSTILSDCTELKLSSAFEKLVSDFQDQSNFYMMV